MDTSKRAILVGDKVYEPSSDLEYDDHLRFREELIKSSKGKEDPALVAKDKIGNVTISTVFLYTDHSFTPLEPSLYFETLIFGGELDGEGDRYTTYNEAYIGHRKFVQKVKQLEEEKLLPEKPVAS